MLGDISNASGVFAESNKMYEIVGIKFDRSAGVDTTIAALGDNHLAKLEEVTKLVLVCVNIIILIYNGHA